MKIMIADICEAFKTKAIGSRVDKIHHDDFMKVLEKAIESHDFSKDRVPGQAVITLPKIVNKWVSPGTQKRGSKEPKDFVVRQYRGEVGMYLKGVHFGLGSKQVRCVVYTRDAYLKDPDCDTKERKKVVEFNKAVYFNSYILVAVLGDCDKNPSTVSYSRFVKNLAGANNEYAVMSKDEVVTLAQKVDDYRKNYIGVSD